MMRPSTIAHPPMDTQPRPVRLSWRDILSFPYRVCNPPPSAGNVRSCQVTPVVKVKLDDVLGRKHLPPLGLKDFEEWLLFVEQCPENLYFILWLQEYAARYDQWVTNAKHFSERANSASSKDHTARSQKPNPALAMFYARAKQTFFTPNSVYELNLPSDILGPFHVSMSDAASNYGHDYPAPNFGAFSAHPDPAVFNQVSFEVRTMLEESLDRFVKATFNNVGTRRAICGIVGGFIIAFVGSVPPIAENFVNGRERWLRILAFPGLWLGLTVFLASLHGVCMMIYIFGDLRQLRSFELARPSISNPQPLRNDMSWYRMPKSRKNYTPPAQTSPTGTIPITRPPINIPKTVYTVPPTPDLILPPSPPAAQGLISPLTPTKPPYRDRYISASTNTPRLTYPSSSSVASSSSNELHHDDTESSSNMSHAIHISEAYYDEQPAYPGEEPISSPVPSSWNSPTPDLIRAPVGCAGRTVASEYAARRGMGASDTPSRYSEGWTTTASFIHPYDPAWDDDLQLEYDGSDEESRVGDRSYGRRPTPSFGHSRPDSTTLSTRASSSVLPSQRQQMDRFDFNALPALRIRPEDRKIGGKPRYRKYEAPPPSPPDDKQSSADDDRKLLLGPKDLLRKIQGRCLAVRDIIRAQFPEHQNQQRLASEKGTEPHKCVSENDSANAVTRKFRMVINVPAFQSPLTKILSPVVTRAQWEIIVKSTTLAFLLSCSLLAGILAAPVVRR